MFFSRILSVSVVFLTLGLGLVHGSPVDGTEVVKRQNPSALLSTLTTLKNSTDVILPQLDALVANDAVTSANVIPLINQLQAAFNSAQTSVNALTVETASGDPVPSDDEVATLIAEILTAVTETLDAVLEKASGIPIIGVLLSGLDVTINGILLSVETLLAGVLVLLGQLLVNVAALLDELSFGLILATLGL